MRRSLLTGKIGPAFAVIYVPTRDDHFTGIGWTISRMYTDRPRLDQAFDRIREQIRASG